MVVNDGSPREFDGIFARLNADAMLLKNAINLGKGAALKQGINFALNTFENPLIITLDADGQHTVGDCCRIKEAFLASGVDFVLGVRDFGGANAANPVNAANLAQTPAQDSAKTCRQKIQEKPVKIPFRSRFGNNLTRLLFGVMFGTKIADTQSGLRAFSPRAARDFLKIPYNGYEFEMQMLITALNRGFPPLQIPIATIYEEGNKSSHFNPIFDSLSIYFVLFRHIGNSLATALIDYFVFAIAFSLGASLLACMLAGRVVAGSFNFVTGKFLVFKTRGNLGFEISAYIALTIVLMLLSMSAIRLVSQSFGASEIVVKPICELMIFALSFLVQRLFIFRPNEAASGESGESCGVVTGGGSATENSGSPATAQRNPAGGGGALNASANANATDWETYYEKRAKSRKSRHFHPARFTRQITTKIILELLMRGLESGGKGAAKNSENLAICEFGGGDSCFYEAFRQRFPNAHYTALDSSKNGVAAFSARFKDSPPKKQEARLTNLLDSPQAPRFDIVFSVGLIEHFDRVGTQKMIEAHFAAAKSGALVLLSYPTPTSLYCLARGVLERLGLWAFVDERPLYFDEVDGAAKNRGKILARRLNYAILLTQEVVLYQKF